MKFTQSLRALMTVYVDKVEIEWNGKLWCHMVADSLEELHSFSRQLGLKRSWFQGDASSPHYDITLLLRDKAISLGAVEVSKNQLVLYAQVLRQQQFYEQKFCEKNQLALF
jgi:hypothetical protein